MSTYSSTHHFEKVLFSSAMVTLREQAILWPQYLVLRELDINKQNSIPILFA